MLGTFAVGKTSLVRRFVESIYTDKYHTTVGVKIDKKMVQLGEKELMLMLWDVEGTETRSMNCALLICVVRPDICWWPTVPAGHAL